MGYNSATERQHYATCGEEHIHASTVVLTIFLVTMGPRVHGRSRRGTRALGIGSASST
jgi:hypothetical protein